MNDGTGTGQPLGWQCGQRSLNLPNGRNHTLGKIQPLRHTIEMFDTISISAGIRGMQILLAPADYLGVTRGIVTPLMRSKSSG